MKERKNRIYSAFLILAASSLLLVISGCASPKYVWYQPGKDRPAYMKDKLECDEEAAQYAKFLDKRGDMDVIGERAKECMGLRGYLRVQEKDVPSGAYRF
mgnify:CR=1 FL=1